MASKSVKTCDMFCRQFGYSNKPFAFYLRDAICIADITWQSRIDGTGYDVVPQLAGFRVYCITETCLLWLRGRVQTNPESYASKDFISLLKALIAGESGKRVDIKYHFEWSRMPDANGIAEMLMVVYSTRSARDVNLGDGGFGEILPSPWFSISLFRRDDDRVYHVKNRGGYTTSPISKENAPALPDGFQSRWEIRVWGKLKGRRNV